MSETQAASSKPQNTFQPGDIILWNPREQPTSLRTTKLAPKLLGPYTVISQHKNNVTCEHIITFQQTIFHTDRITLSIISLPAAKQAALLDSDEYTIQKNSAHRGAFQNNRQQQFVVLWDGYDESSDTWEPWRELMHT